MQACRKLLAAGAFGVVLLGNTTPGAASMPAAPSAPAKAESLTADAVIIGDSVLGAVELSAAARANLSSRYSFEIDAKVCRRLISKSCAYRGVTPSTALEALRGIGGTFGVLVIGAGYNDSSISTAIDTFLTEARTRGIPKVVWINYHEAGIYAADYVRHNSTLRARLSRYPELSIIDWNAAVGRHPDWVTSDGIHLTSNGALGMADAVGDALDGIDDPLPPPNPTPAPARCSLAHEAAAPAVGVAAEPGAPIGFTTLAGPVRFLDTRTLPAPIDHRSVITVPIAGLNGVPPGAVAVAATVTAVDTCAATYLSAFPCGGGPPGTSIVNARAGATVADGAVVALGTGGAICIYTDGATDLLVDVSGWLDPAGAGLVPMTPPVRLLDTRPGTPHLLPAAHRLVAGETLTVPAGGFAPVVGSGLLALNVTAVQPAAAGHLTVFPGPCDKPRPEVSNLNVVAGRDVAAGAVVSNTIGGPGDVCVYSSVATDVLVDLTAVSAPGAARISTVGPLRAVDTRRTVALTAGQVFEVGLPTNGPAAGPGPIGLIGHLTAVDPAAGGYLTAYPCGATVPEVSSLNVRRGETVANMIITGLGDAQQPDLPRLCIYSSVATHILLDVTGWLVPDVQVPA